MDNLTHTLAGAILGEVRKGPRPPMATATLLIGANLPDVDGITYWIGDQTALTWRRGWTHGLLAMAVLPLVLSAAMMSWDGIASRLRRRPDRERARFARLLPLASVSVLSHPLLDFLNTYGVRFLSPFSDRWFYGDALFIVDPWIWALLGGGIVFARLRRRHRALRPERPARLALAAAAIYIAVMLLSGWVGRALVARRAGGAVHREMVGPVKLDPFRRAVVVDDGGALREPAGIWWLPHPPVIILKICQKKAKPRP